MSRLTATIVVTTRDRVGDLRRLLASAVEQTADAEVLVVDDASRDGTAELVRRDFPEVRLDVSPVSRGYIHQRNRAADLARGEVIVSVDDDAVLPSRHTVAQTLEDFDQSRIGAVAIPFIDVRRGPDVRQRAPRPDGRWLTSTYIGTAHAVRRDVFIATGRYRESLGHQVEEPDFCLRMLDAGYVTRLGRADPLEHHESPSRNWDRLHYLSCRNHVLHGYNNVPMPYLPARLAKITLTLAWASRQHARAAVSGLWAGHAAGLRALGGRQAVRRSTYRLDHEIRKRPVSLEEVEARLPPPVAAAPSKTCVSR